VVVLAEMATHGGVNVVFGGGDVVKMLLELLLYRSHVWSTTFVTKIRMPQNIGNFTTLLKPHNIGTHLKGIETSFQMAPLFLKSLHFWVSYITF
jgi:hypothetical protein